MATLPIVMREYSEDEPRDEAGRWTDGSGASNGISVPKRAEDKALFEKRYGARAVRTEHGALYNSRGDLVAAHKGTDGSMDYKDETP